MEKYTILCLIDPTDGVGIWIDITKLFYRPYWSRIWVLQELYLARDIFLICRTRSLGFAHFLCFDDSFLSAVNSQQSRPDFVCRFKYIRVEVWVDFPLPG